jgi:uncharacterized protein
MTDGQRDQARQIPLESVAAEKRSRATGWLQPTSFADALYGSVRIAGWAAALLETAPFQRLADISLSDVPGTLLFGRPFPSRLDHAIGAYHLTRRARPRDRALQAAALAHDLGHGPFSHLSEPLMRERLGMDHEQRSARLVFAVRDALPAWIRRYLDWLDWEEVAALVEGKGSDGRGALLNGLLDYDNIDNVARFLLASGLGTPGYDPVLLARGLAFIPDDQKNGGSMACVGLNHGAAGAAHAWQHDRRIVYDFLHSGHHNLALHAMLRKAIDLDTERHTLASDFLDLTDGDALTHLSASPQLGVATLIAGVVGDTEYRAIWDANLGPEHDALRALLSSRLERLRMEARLASEAGFAEHEVIVEPIVSSAERALPPIAGLTGRDESAAAHMAWPATSLKVFVAPGAPNDYVHRLRMAASRQFAAFGVPRVASQTLR